MREERINALSEFLEVEIEEIEEVDDNIFEVSGEEYLVLTDEEANNYFRDYKKGLLDDMGIESFTDWAREYILNNFVDSEWFDDAMQDSYRFYCEDIENESAYDEELFNNRLEEEIEDCDCEDMEEYIQYLCNNWDNGIEWYIDSFCMECFSNCVTENNLIDYDAVIEWILETDGRGCLASYDGEENEQYDFYIYRTN